MQINDDEVLRLDRRRALKLVGIGLTSVGGILALAGCKKEEAAEVPAAKPTAPTGGGLCQFKVPVDEAARQMRRTLQYQEKSNQPGKKCGTCSQFEAGKYGECGGCKLFGGGVNPEGVCLSYAPLGAPAAPGAPAAVPGKAG
jgi:hypothetical protein